MFRPNSGHLQVITILLKEYHICICLYCEVMLRSHHRYALKSVYLVFAVKYHHKSILP